MQTFVGQSGPRTLMTIKMAESSGRDVRDFSLFPGENEVLFPPNMCFEVVDSFDAGNQLIMVQCRQTETVDVILDLNGKRTGSGGTPKAPAMPAPAPQPPPSQPTPQPPPSPAKPTPQPPPPSPAKPTPQPPASLAKPTPQPPPSPTKPMLQPPPSPAMPTPQPPASPAKPTPQPPAQPFKSQPPVAPLVIERESHTAEQVQHFRGPCADCCKPLAPCCCVSADGEKLYGCIPARYHYFLPLGLHVCMCPQMGCQPCPYIWGPFAETDYYCWSTTCLSVLSAIFLCQIQMYGNAGPDRQVRPLHEAKKAA
jgi:hypothetical protein